MYHFKAVACISIFTSQRIRSGAGAGISVEKCKRGTSSTAEQIVYTHLAMVIDCNLVVFLKMIKECFFLNLFM